MCDKGWYYYNFPRMNVLKYFEGWGKFSIFGRNSWVLKVLAHEMSDETQKIKNLQFSMCYEGRYQYNFPRMNVLKYFVGWRKLSIFGRNSWVLKVLAHEMSDETQKN